MMPSRASPDVETSCKTLSSFPDWPGEASADAGPRRTSARTAPHTALLDGLLMTPLVGFVRSSTTARTDPSPAAREFASAMFTMSYRRTTFVGTDAFRSVHGFGAAQIF